MAAVSVRHELNGGASLERWRSILGAARPVSVRTLLAQWQGPLTLEEPLVTGQGVALGGHQKVTLERDGKWRFEGHFRATGWPSYRVSLATHVQGQDTVLVFATSGEVFGSNKPGSREATFDQSGVNQLIRARWASLYGAKLAHDLEYDTNFFGTAGDVLAFLAKAAVATALGGLPGLVIVVGLEAIDAAGLQKLALPGTVGLLIAGGVLLAFGPGAIIAAVIAGVAAGTIVTALVKQRPLFDDEFTAATRVFGNTLPRNRILLTNLTGFGGRPFTMPGPANAILVNLGHGYDDPLRYTGIGGEEQGKQAAGQLLMHELTHAWQIANSEFIPGLMCLGIMNQVGTLGGNMDVYKYGLSNRNWGEYNLEQQASIVDQWFGGNGQQKDPGPLCEDDRNPYWHFIRDNIRAAVA